MKTLREALAPLVNIAKAYYDNSLDDEARRFWGKNTGTENENNRDPSSIELYTGRGGGRLLTLQDCFDAKAAVDAKDVAGPVDWDQPVFPKTRKEQADFIETLSGDILLREQDYPAWLALRECAAVLRGLPELDSPRGQWDKRYIMAQIGGNRR